MTWALKKWLQRPMIAAASMPAPTARNGLLPQQGLDIPVGGCRVDERRDHPWVPLVRNPADRGAGGTEGLCDLIQCVGPVPEILCARIDFSNESESLVHEISPDLGPITKIFVVSTSAWRVPR